MTTTQFEELVEKHSLKPDDIHYNIIGLCGEVGELANVIRKIEIRKTLHESEVVSAKTMEEYNNNVIEELGDILFFLTRVSMDNGVPLEELMLIQKAKLGIQDIKYRKTFLK